MVRKPLTIFSVLVLLLHNLVMDMLHVAYLLSVSHLRLSS